MSQDTLYAGLDIGATYVRLCVAGNDIKETLPRVEKIRLPHLDSPEQEVLHICEVLEQMVAEIQDRSFRMLGGIGVSLAAIFNRKTGNVIRWPNNPKWNGFALKSFLEKRFNVPVVLEDDANTAALGEFCFLKDELVSNMAFITVSTGIGCGLILNKELFIGDNGWAGEIGHIQFDHNGPECTCGKRGCLQAFASGKAILSKVTSSMQSPALTFDEAVTLARKGVMPHKKVFEESALYISKAVQLLITLLDIRLFVIGGGVTNAGTVFWDPLLKSLQNDHLELDRRVRIIPSELNDKNGVIGALALINKEISK